MENQIAKNNIIVPVAIIIAGLLIAGAIIYTNGIGERAPREVSKTDSVLPVTEDDHIKGDINASVKIVEFSDFECPFCKGFHGTMNQIMDEYGDSGKVAWIYRQFPLDSLHPVKARAEAIATECANELGGNDMFWEFADRMFELTLSNNRTDIETVIPQIANELGIDEQDFNTCMNSGNHDERIESNISDAVNTGGTGTPWSVIIAPNGKTFPLSGAQSYDSVKQLIEIALKEKK